ncbi:MAG: hypothetical protein Q7T33_04795 [Dehalococcoidia bacterium]|nr:hypothetical protein [Dehalococcoidia bacterium]
MVKVTLVTTPDNSSVLNTANLTSPAPNDKLHGPKTSLQATGVSWLASNSTAPTNPPTALGPVPETFTLMVTVSAMTFALRNITGVGAGDGVTTGVGDGEALALGGKDTGVAGACVDLGVAVAVGV